MLLAAMLFWSVAMVAQTYTVTGNVTDAKDGLPLPGVSILIKGTTNGTITDFDGNYTLKVPAVNEVLVFTFVGYDVTEVLFTGQSTINVALNSKLEQLSELLVIGYGVQKKEDKTGAVAQIEAKDFNGGGLTDPIQAIQGKTAGVTITKKGGDPNSGFAVKIRGASGFDANTDPLYIIDGVVGADPTIVAPEDIKTFDVLKDAASTAIYGSQGANGVIIINTKSGEKGKGTVQFNAKFSMDQIANKLDLLSATEIRDYVNKYNLDFTDGGANTDWQDEVFRTGISQNYNLNFSGGSETSNYFASVSHSDWEGIMKGTSKERTTARIKLTHKGLDNKLSLSSTLLGTFETNDYENYDGFDKDDILYQVFSRNPTDPVYNENGDYYQLIRAFNYENPLSVIDKVDNIREAKRFLGNLKADYEFVPGLTGTISIGYTKNDRVNSVFRYFGVFAAADNGYGKREYENDDSKLLESYFTYAKTYNSSHSINILGGYSWQEKSKDGFYAQAENPQSEYIKYNNLGSFIDITRSSISSWASSSRLIGFFGRVQYNYKSKYYLTASLRRDGSSKFGINKKWGTFPTASLGWNAHEESFLRDVSWIGQLKLRASYGVSGNQEIGDYNSRQIFYAKDQVTDPETGKQVISFSPPHNPNPDLQWERTKETNFGIDFGFFRNRLNGSIEVFNKLTDKLLGEYQVPVPPNLVPKTFVNTGSLTNQGVELLLQGHIIDKRNLKWSSSLSTTYIKTKIVSLGNYVNGDVRREGYITGRGLIGDANFITGNIEGEELAAFYLPVFVKLSDDGVFLYKSNSGGITRDLGEAKREIVGSPLPDFEFGWTNNFTFFKSFTLDMSFRSLIGNDVYNATKMFFDYPGLLPSLNAMPDALDWKEKKRSSGPSIADIYVEDGTFLKLDYVALGYNVPVKKLKNISALNVYVSANNVFTLTNYSGVDPETSYTGLSFGIDQFDVYPKSRTFTFGLNVTF